MFEFIILLVSAMPFLVGIYAVRLMKKNDDEGSDDQPPPPDPQPPQPQLPPSPEPRRLRRRAPRPAGRSAVQHGRVRTPAWPQRVRH